MNGIKIGTSWIGNSVYIYYPTVPLLTTTWINKQEGILTVSNDSNDCLAIFDLMKENEQIFLLECLYCSNCKLVALQEK